LLLYLTFFSLLCAADALAAANDRISSLEAELEASRKAWDAATATKTTTEKSTKSALVRAKKAEKALSNANKERIQWEQAVTERLDKMSALARGKYHAFPFFVELLILMLPDVYFFPLSLFPWLFRTYWGVFGIFAARR
jgi:septal ring factor EnvC (AmiA/AmiB activator)